VGDLIAIAVVGTGSYLFRAVFILGLANRRIPIRILVALRFVAPAVMAALIVALLSDAEGNVAIGIPEIAAFVIGGATAYRTRNHIWTLLAGMSVFWIVRGLV
jgi:branched-subunit amino acid transport protein